MSRAETLTEAVRRSALELGFDRVAIGPADPPEHAGAFVRWLDEGYGGTMGYLARGADARLDPRRLLPGARSTIAVALSYHPAEECVGAGLPDGAADPAAGWESVARYARGRDYHDVMRPRLASLARRVRELAGQAARCRIAVDTSAVLERDLAARAGLGWIGKNTNLLDERLGSMFFIGIVLTTAVLDADVPVPDRCGTCTACLDACPTQAFVAPYVLDARRCISYLTIEHRGQIAGELRAPIGEWAFGCDVCQTVCPWNRKAAPSRDPALAADRALEPLTDLLALDDAGFRRRFRGSAIMRAKRTGFLRNAAIVLGNRGDTAAVPALRRAASDPDPTVRDAAIWALEQLGAGTAMASGASGAPWRPTAGAPAQDAHAETHDGSSP